MQDFNGKELNVGDKVITTMSNGRSGSYAGYSKGIVVGFTPKMIKIVYANSSRSLEFTTKKPYSVAKYEWKGKDE